MESWEDTQKDAESEARSREEKIDAILAETAEKAAAEEGQTENENAEQNPNAEPYTLKQFLGDVMDLMESVITSIFVVMLIFTFLFCVANVDGDSMLPTLTDGDRLIVSRHKSSYSNGDILILDSESAYTFNEDGDLVSAPGLGKNIVKRLIAQGGQEVYIDFAEGIVYVDDKPLTEPYTAALTTRDNGAFTYPITVPEGYIFVLGDNRHISKDSRHPDIGLVPAADIVGKVILRIAPFRSFGWVESATY